MTTIAEAARIAAEELYRIADRSTGVRSARCLAGAIVFRAIALDGTGPESSTGAAFLHSRAAAEVGKLPAGVERRALRRLLRLLHLGPESLRQRCSETAQLAGGDSSSDALSDVLLAYAGELERTSRLSEAGVVFDFARALWPRDPLLALHAGRVARKVGDPTRALMLYGLARELDTLCGHLSRLAEIGEALVSPDPVQALGAAVRSADRAGDEEAVAVALEERARIHSKADERWAALRDLSAASLRYTDPADRARVLHRLADVALDAEDSALARATLLRALDAGDGAQRERARSRLFSLSHALGDEVGQRRWRPALHSTPARPAHAQMDPPE